MTRPLVTRSVLPGAAPKTRCTKEAWLCQVFDCLSTTSAAAVPAAAALTLSAFVFFKAASISGEDRRASMASLSPLPSAMLVSRANTDGVLLPISDMAMCRRTAAGTGMTLPAAVVLVLVFGL